MEVEPEIYLETSIPFSRLFDYQQEPEDLGLFVSLNPELPKPELEAANPKAKSALAITRPTG